MTEKELKEIMEIYEKQQAEARAKKQAEIEESSGWLWDAIKRKRGF